MNTKSIIIILVALAVLGLAKIFMSDDSTDIETAQPEELLQDELIVEKVTPHIANKAAQDAGLDKNNEGDNKPLETVESLSSSEEGFSNELKRELGYVDLSEEQAATLIRNADEAEAAYFKELTPEETQDLRSVADQLEQQAIEEGVIQYDDYEKVEELRATADKLELQTVQDGEVEYDFDKTDALKSQADDLEKNIINEYN